MKKAKLERIDLDFKEWAEDISTERVKNGLDKKTVSIREVTRMLMNTDNLINVEEELLKKSRKND
jgi:hypothetical protein